MKTCGHCITEDECERHGECLDPPGEGEGRDPFSRLIGWLKGLVRDRFEK